MHFRKMHFSKGTNVAAAAPEVRCAIQDFLAMAPNDRGALRRRISLTPEQTKLSRFNDLMEQHGLSHKTDHVFGKKRL